VTDGPDLTPLVRWLARLAVSDYLKECEAAGEKKEFRNGRAAAVDEDSAAPQPRRIPGQLLDNPKG
jgi:hypothetical protein